LNRTEHTIVFGLSIYRWSQNKHKHNHAWILTYHKLTIINSRYRSTRL